MFIKGDEKMAKNSRSKVSELSLNALKETGRFVGRYWDLVAAVGCGLAINDYEGRVLGAYREPILLSLGSLSLLSSELSPSRFIRNCFGGLTSTFAFYENGVANPSVLERTGYYSAALATGLFALIGDREAKLEAERGSVK